MEYHFTKQEILNAIFYLDENLEEFKGRSSSTYDLVFNGKKYPPILVLSKANELKGGSPLLLVDFNNSVDKAFKYLTDNGFVVKPKVDKMINFKEFITIANEQVTGKGTNINATNFIRKNKGFYKGLKVDISFGVGRASAVPWIVFLGENQKVKNGIYPALLYYKSLKILILAYGISESSSPSSSWNNENSKITIYKYIE